MSVGRKRTEKALTVASSNARPDSRKGEQVDLHEKRQPAGGFGVGANETQDRFGAAGHPPRSAWLQVLLTLGAIGAVFAVFEGALGIWVLYRHKRMVHTAEAYVGVREIAAGAGRAYERDGKLCPTVRRMVPSQEQLGNARKAGHTWYAATDEDFRNAGFDCLEFKPETAMHFMFDYRATADSFEAIGHGDLNGDGKFSTFTMRGRLQDGKMKLDPEVESIDELE